MTGDGCTFTACRYSTVEEDVSEFGFFAQNLVQSASIIRSGTFDPSGEEICIGTADGDIEIYDIQNDLVGKYTQTLGYSDDEINQTLIQTRLPKYIGTRYHKNSIFEIKYSPDGSILATCSNDKTIHLLDRRRLELSLNTLFPYSGESFRPQQHNIEISGSLVRDDTQIHKIIFHQEHSVRSINFNTCLSLVSGGSGDCSLKLWDLNSKKIVHIWKQHSAPITCVESIDTNIVASGSIDKRVFCNDIRCRKPIHIPICIFNRYPSRVNDIKIIPTGNDYWVIVGYQDSCIICYSMKSQRFVWQSIHHKQACQSGMNFVVPRMYIQNN